MKIHQRVRTHKVTEINRRTRIIDYCGPVFPILGSKSATKKAIAARRLFLNGRLANGSEFLNIGDVIELRGTGVHQVKKLDIDVPVVYEDDYLIIVNKPGGIAVNGNRYKTVENALAEINRNNPINDALPRPIAVHRIDVPTNGLVMLAKTKTAQIKLGKIFQANEVKKEYFAVVHGKPPKQGRINEPIEGKRAVTDFETLRTVPSHVYEHLSLMKLKPITGRTHQLRVHLKNQGHFIVGDKMYAGGNKTILGKGVLLCARQLRFSHPINGKAMDISIDPPAKFEKLLQREEGRFINKN